MNLLPRLTESSKRDQSRSASTEPRDVACSELPLLFHPFLIVITFHVHLRHRSSNGSPHRNGPYQQSHLEAALPNSPTKAQGTDHRSSDVSDNGRCRCCQLKPSSEFEPCGRWLTPADRRPRKAPRAPDGFVSESSRVEALDPGLMEHYVPTLRCRPFAWRNVATNTAEAHPRWQLCCQDGGVDLPPCLTHHPFCGIFSKVTIAGASIFGKGFDRTIRPWLSHPSSIQRTTVWRIGADSSRFKFTVRLTTSKVLCAPVLPTFLSFALPFIFDPDYAADILSRQRSSIRSRCDVRADGYAS
jgi:hypothetical protein